MNNFQRIYQLHRILTSHRLPVSHKDIEEQLECSRATVTRTINTLRDYFNAPVVYDRERNGYYYDDRENKMFELPGVWFDANELYTLLTMQQLLEHIQPGFLGAQLQPIKNRLEKILAAQYLNKCEISSRIRLLTIMGRCKTTRHFKQVTSALLQRKQLNIVYHSRSHDRQTLRIVSPQRLTHYRDNWYLDAWCHKRNALRSFAIERIKTSVQIDDIALDIAGSELDEHFTVSYGIFAGKANQIAVLHFTAERARWVAEEQWHPKQETKFLPDGRFELRIPYANEIELVMDILKHGASVEVIAPESLRQAIITTIRKMQRKYEIKKNKKN